MTSWGCEEKSSQPFFLYELIYSVIEVLEAIAVTMVSVADAVLDMILQDYLGGIIERRAHRRKLDEHIGAVPPILDHALHGLKVPDGAGKPVHDGLSLRVRMPVTVLMSVGMGVDMTVAMVVIIQLPGIMLLGKRVYVLVCHSLSSFIKDTPKACPWLFYVFYMKRRRKSSPGARTVGAVLHGGVYLLKYAVVIRLRFAVRRIRCGFRS